jgi:hypothetical protein
MKTKTNRILLRIILVSLIIIGFATLAYIPNPDNDPKPWPAPWPAPWPYIFAFGEIFLGISGLFLENKVFKSNFRN